MPNKKLTAFRLDPESAALLEELAAREASSKAHIVRRAIRELARRYGIPATPRRSRASTRQTGVRHAGVRRARTGALGGR